MRVFPPETCARYRAEGQWGDVTLPGMLEATAARVPDRIGIADPPDRAAFFEGAPRRLTYAQMQAGIEGHARALAAHGLGPGSLIAVQLPSIAEMMLVYLAVARIGAVLSPVPMAYRAGEIRNIAGLAELAAFISVGRFKGRDHYAERLPALPPGVLRLGLGEGLPEGVTPLTPAEGGPVHDAGDPDGLFAVVWTSGTEGLPKAVPKTHNNMMASSLGAWRILGLPDGANILAPFPFVNAAAMGGLMMCWMRTAGTLILHQPFDLEVFLGQLQAERIDYTMMAPTLLARMRERARDAEVRAALGRLRAVGTGAAPPDPEVFAQYQEALEIPVVNFFGSNEGAQLCAAPDRVPDPRQRARFFARDGDVGWEPHRRTANGGVFRLVDPETGAQVTAPGAIGEMRIAGPAMMPGYYTRACFDRAKFDEDGWFRTGDLFEIAEDPGLIRFHGRAREIISRGGMKISPAELDAVLSAMPGVREAAAASYPCPEMGERVCAFLVPEGAAPDLAAVTAHCDAAGLARFKWPERVEILDALPRNPLMKIDRRALSARLAPEGAENA